MGDIGTRFNGDLSCGPGVRRLTSGAWRGTVKNQVTSIPTMVGWAPAAAVAAEGPVAGLLVVAGIVVAGMVVAGMVVAGIVVAGIEAASIVAAGIEAAGNAADDILEEEEQE